MTQYPGKFLFFLVSCTYCPTDRYEPDKSFFGTPRSRLLEGQTPLEKLAGQVQGGSGQWSHEGPIERSRHQRMQGQDRHHMDQEEKDEKYKNLPGVRTGTTALGLVEHRGNQPFFHVPVFTTPIPKNGKFVTRNPNPLRGFAASLRNITSNLSKKLPTSLTRITDKLPSLPSPVDGLARLHEAMKGATKVKHGTKTGFFSTLQVRERTLAPATRPSQNRNRGVGRRLDTFSRWHMLRPSLLRFTFIIFYLQVHQDGKLQE